MLINWEMIGVVLALIVNAGSGIWWASKLTAKMDGNKDTLCRIEKDIEKREARVDAAWRKIDTHEHRLTVVETKCKIHPYEEGQ